MRKLMITAKKFKSLRNVKWFTKLEHSHLPKGVRLEETYSPENYPKYDNYDAIEVSQYTNMPKDYAGLMGVPISFITHLNPKQFELVDLPQPRPTIDGRTTYARLLIKAKPGFTPPKPPSPKVVEKHKRKAGLRKKYLMELYAKQVGKCANPKCLHNEYQEYFPPDFMDVDHIVPISKGGSNEFDNLQLLYRKCNGKKGDKTTNRSSMPLLLQVEDI